MESKIFKIGILALFFLLNGCGNDVTGPGEQAPLLFPLAQGTNWIYNITSYNSMSSDLFGSSSTKYCLAEIEVEQASYRSPQNDYLLKVHFTIDSVITSQSSRLTGVYVDSTHTLKNVLDTTYSCEMIARQNALYWKNDSTLDYFLPLMPTWGSKVNLAFFNFGYFNLLDADLDYSLQSNAKNYKYYGDYDEIKANFSPDSGGLTSVSYNLSEGELTHIERLFSLQLLHYSPGR